MQGDYHSRATSIGTKRAIAPYWSQYKRGKDRAATCPQFSKIKREDGSPRYCCAVWKDQTDARDLYYRRCGTCPIASGLCAVLSRVIHEKRERLRFMEGELKSSIVSLKERVGDWQRWQAEHVNDKDRRHDFFGYTLPLKEYAQGSIFTTRSEVVFILKYRAELAIAEARYDQEAKGASK